MNVDVGTIRRSILLAATLGLASVSTNGQNARGPASPPGLRLSERACGEAAIEALGAGLPKVAAQHGKTSRQLREAFRADRSLHVNSAGELIFACPLECEDHAAIALGDEVVANSIGPTDPAPFDTDEAFLLHSRPGANRVIYLDFDGHIDNTPGNWKEGASAPPYNISGSSPSSFSPDERNRIIEIWQRVSEDYSMYEIDVTTEEPNIEDLRKTSSGDARYGIRVVIGGKASDWFGSNVGGVAIVGSFDLGRDVPCWVFSQSLGAAAKTTAEAASHEAGHTLGLLHDGIDGGVGYYGGQGNWGTIMGLSYSKPISQWSKGEYKDANNTQDDLAVMLTQGAVYRSDDHGNTTSTATKLNPEGSSVSVNGVIERNTDRDYFQIIADNGLLEIDTAPATLGANLRLQVKLYDASGGQLQTATSPDNSNGTQPVTLIYTVSTGIYYFSVEGIGSGDPLTNGYSDYASIGQYSATVTGVLASGSSSWQPVTGGARSWNASLNWLPGTVPDSAGTLVRINHDITGDQTIGFSNTFTIGSLFVGDANGTHKITFAGNGGTLIFDNSGNPAEINKNTGATDTVAVPVVLHDDLVVSQSAPGNLEFSGGISGSGSLTKIGAGTMVFNTTNTYSGTTVLAGGLLLLTDSGGLPGGIDNAAGLGESVLFFKGGVLGLYDDFTRGLGTGAGQLNWNPKTGGTGSGGFAAFGADREVRLNNSTSICSWATTILGTNSILILSDPTATHTLDFRNDISFSTQTRTVQVEDGAAAVDAILSGRLVGTVDTSAGLNKTGAGVLSLTNANNTYPGATTVAGGVLRLENPGALPSGNLEISDGIVGLGAGDLVNRTIGTGIDQLRWTGEGGFAAFGADRAVRFTPDPNSSINWNTPNFISAGKALILGHDTADATLDWQQKFSLSGSPRVIQVDDGSAMIDVKMSGIIAGGTSGATNNVFNKTGAGTLAFTAQNTYAGDTIVSLGTLMIGDGGTSGGVSQNSPVISVDSGATLAVNRSNTITQGTDPLKVAVTGDGGFAQVGPGSTLLMLVNTYIGPTNIEAGTLTLGASGVLPDSTTISIGDATLEAGAGFSNTVGSLEVTGAATIHLANTSSSLSFANSSSEIWTGTLDLSGSFVSGSSIRFGTNGNGLSATQLSRISINGNSENLALDANGYLINGYEVWKTTYAPTTGEDPAADEDGDGVNNAMEYVLGGSIQNNDSGKLLHITTDGGGLSFFFTRDQRSIDGSTTVVIETSPDLSQWPITYPVPVSATSSIPGVSVIKNTPPGYDTVTLVLPLSSNPKRFFRLKVIP